MAKRNQLAVPILSMVTSGDAARNEAGASEVMRNAIVEAGGKVSKRSGWDSTANASVSVPKGFARWQDEVNAAEKLIALDAAAFNVWSGSTWGSDITGSTTALGDYTNHRGRLIWSDDTTLRSYDGTTADAQPFDETIRADSVASWIGRVFLGRAKQAITNELTTTTMYGGSWATTTLTINSITEGGKTTTRFTPTTSSGVVEATATPVSSLAASAEPVPYVWRSDLRLESADKESLPVTLGLAVAAPAVQRTTAYVVGDLVLNTPSPAATYFPLKMYRCTTAGTTAGAAPNYPPTTGNTITDGTAVFTCEGSPFFATVETFVSSKSGESWQTEWVSGSVPPRKNAVGVYATILWGHMSRFEAGATQTITPLTLQVGFKDGLADTNPAKANKGQQVTQGKFFYEFVNTESGVTRTLDMPNRVYFTDALTYDIDADNYIDFTECPGPVTAVRAIDDDTLAIFKRKGILLVAPGPKADLPVVRGQYLPGVGALHARAIDQFEGITYFIGEYGVYAMNGNEAPREITSDAIRDSVMSRTNWIEDSATAAAAFPTLRVHQKRKEVWAMTQQKKIWVYSIPRKAWTYIDVVKDGSDGTSEIQDFIFFDDEMHLCATTNGLLKEGSVRDEVYSGGSATAYSTKAELWLRPIESLRREGILIESIELRHKATGSQASHTLTAYVSTDDGVTFPRSHAVTLTASTGGLTTARIPLWQSGSRLTVKLVSEGDAGSSIFNCFEAVVWFQVKGSREPAPTNATSVTASL